MRVREALARSIDKKTLVENVIRGGQIATDAFVPLIGEYVPVKGLSYDVEKARKLLADAGYPNGKGFPTLTVLYNTNENHKTIAEYIQQEWLENLGINIKLENMEWKTFLKERRTGNFQIVRNGWVGDYFDPNTFLDLYITDGESNGIKYSNAQYDALLSKAAREKDIKTRMGLLRQAESLLIEQDIGLIPLYYYTSSNMFNNEKWEGFYSNIADDHNLKFIKPKK